MKRFSLKDASVFIVENFDSKDFIDASVELGEVAKAFPNRDYSLVCFTAPNCDRVSASVIIPSEYFDALSGEDVVLLFRGTKRALQRYLLDRLDDWLFVNYSVA